MKTYKLTIGGSEFEVSVNETNKNIDGIPALDRTAIAMAIHLYYNDEEVHDVESGVLTITNVDRRYSPWNSKVFGLNNTLNR